jgi:transposase
MSKPKRSVVFKAYTQNQAMLLPPSLYELIAADHPVRIVNQVLEKIDIEPLLKKYTGGGSSSFHPRMLLKVLVFAYINNNYSSRKIEAALKENIHYMWLSAMSTPDHNTINRFRSERLKEVLRQVFTRGSVVAIRRRAAKHKRIIYRWNQDRSQCGSLYICMG